MAPPLPTRKPIQRVHVLCRDDFIAVLGSKVREVHQASSPFKKAGLGVYRLNAEARRSHVLRKFDKSVRRLLLRSDAESDRPLDTSDKSKGLFSSPK